MRIIPFPLGFFSQFRIIVTWEQRKLGEVFEQTSEYVNPKVENIELWSLTVKNGLTPKTERYNREFLVKKEGDFKSVPNNEFIYNPMNMTLGAVDLNSTGKKVAVSGYYITMKTTEDYDNKYFSFWLKTPIAIKQYKIFATGTLIERQRVQFPALSKIKTLIPSKEEQTQIGNFFEQLDNLITLHQRKLDALKQLKEAYLQNMFPMNRESVPKLRFANFEEKWEQRKLGDLADFGKGKGFSKGDLSPDGEPIILYGRLYTNYQTVIKVVDTFAKPKGNDILSVGNEVIVPSSGETAEDIARASVVSSSGVLLGGDLNVIKVKNNLHPAFVALFLSNGRGKMELIKKSQGTSVVHLYNSDLKKVNIFYPLLEEQQKIGNFFNQLDNAITLHQQKLEQLQNLKKAYLQKMFI